MSIEVRLFVCSISLRNCHFIFNSRLLRVVVQKTAIGPTPFYFEIAKMKFSVKMERAVRMVEKHRRSPLQRVHWLLTQRALNIRKMLKFPHHWSVAVFRSAICNIVFSLRHSWGHSYIRPKTQLIPYNVRTQNGPGQNKSRKWLTISADFFSSYLLERIFQRNVFSRFYSSIQGILVKFMDHFSGIKTNSRSFQG